MNTSRIALLARRCTALAGALILAGTASPALARPGYANLINSFCSAQGRERTTYTDDGCTLCHHSGTFTTDPEHRLEPQWTEFEAGRNSGDYSFFCPGDGSAALVSADTGDADQPAPDTGANADMSWMALGYPNGHKTTMATESRAQGASVSAPGAASATPATPAPPSAAESLSPPSPDAQTAAEVKSKLATLHSELGIGRTQESVWQELADAVLAASAPAAAGALPGGTLSDQLQQQQRRQAQRTAQLRAVNTATVRLNAQLDAKQQRLLSARLPALISEP